MKTRMVIFLICLVALTGCRIFGLAHAPARLWTSNDLNIHRVYPLPSKNKICRSSFFHDLQLEQLIAISLHETPSIAVAHARIKKAEAVAKEANASLWPSVSLHGGALADHFSIRGTFPPQFGQLDIDKLLGANLTLNFNYELDLWGKNRAQLQAKISEAYAAKMDFLEAKLILSSNLATTYFEAQEASIQRKLAADIARLAKLSEGIVLDRAKQGLESDLPVNTAIINAQNAQLAVQAYELKEKKARYQLAVLIGKNPFNTDIVLSPFQTNPLHLPKKLPANLLARRPDLAAACALAKAAAYQVNVAKTAFFPNINLNGLLSVQSYYLSRIFNFRFAEEGVSAALDLPIFDAGKRRARLHQKYADYEIAVNQYNQTLLNALEQVRNALASLQTLKGEITVQKRSLTAIEKSYQLFQSQYRQGIIDYLRLIEVKQSVMQQKSQLIDLQTKYKQAFVSLLAALGEGVLQ